MEYIGIVVILLFFVMMSVLGVFSNTFSSEDFQTEKKSDAQSKGYTKYAGTSNLFKNARDRENVEYSEDVRLLGALLVRNPQFYKLTEDDFKNAGFNFFDASNIMSVAKTWGAFVGKKGESYLDANLLVAAIMEKELPFSERRNLLHKLFELANIGDGIKDDEWFFIMDVMNGLKMNSANTSYLLRLYSGWRTGAPSGGEADVPQRFFLGECLVRVVNEVLYLSPESRKKDELVRKFFLNNFKNCASYLKKLGKHQDEPTLRQAVDVINQKVSLKARLSFAKMLYSLAAVDDGIKYDEWLLLGFLLEQLRLFKSASTFYRRYSGLRTEQNNYDTYSYFSSKYYGANNSNSQSFGSQKQSSGKSSSASKVDTRLAEAFEVLEISSTATKEEVQEAYHRLALQHHPDLPKNAERRAECVRAMAKINVAYATVSKSFV